MSYNADKIVKIMDQTMSALQTSRALIKNESPDSSISVFDKNTLDCLPFAIAIVDENGFLKEFNSFFAFIAKINKTSQQINILDFFKTDEFAEGLKKAVKGIGSEFLFSSTTADDARFMFLLPAHEKENIRLAVCIIASETFPGLEIQKEPESRYRMMIEKANDGIVIIKNGFFEFFNHKIIESTGYQEKELKEKPFLDFIHPDDVEKVLKKYQERLAGKKLENIYPVRIIKKDGSEIWTEVNAVSVVWKEAPATLVIIRDLTIQKKLEEELAQAKKMEAIGTMAGGIAHNFNNILSAIIGYTELGLADPETGEKNRHRHAQVLKSAIRAKEMVRKIMIFSMKNMEDKRPMKLSGLVWSGIEKFKAEKSSGISIKISINTSNDIINSRPEQLEEVFLQIFKNAANAIGNSEGIISISVEDSDCTAADSNNSRSELPAKSKKYVMLSIKDTGSGMPKAVLDRIFEPYFTTMEPGKGIGLGLPFVHGIIKSHGGFIKVASAPGRWSEFSIFLPLCDSTDFQSFSKT